MELSNNGKNTKKLKPLDPQIAKWGPIGRNASTVNANKGIGNSNWLSAMKGIAPPPPVMGRTKPKSRFLGASAPTAAPISGLASLNTPPQNENNVFPAAKPAAAAENEASWFNNPLFGTKRKGPLVSAQRANEQLTAMEQKFREINKLKGNSAAKNARIAALEAQLKKAEAEVSRLTGKAKTRAALGPFARS
jgi:hypothetical protein